MKKWLYTLIPLAIIAGPLALSFDQKVHFISHIVPVLVATLSIGCLYLLWDIVVVKRGDWAFNDQFVGQARIFNLPIGEILFFLTVPYACLFLYEVGVAYIGRAMVLAWPVWASWVLAGIAIIAVVVYRRQGYTVLALGSMAVFLVAQAMVFPELPGRSDFLFFMGSGLLVFVLFNGIYTALPTIFYNQHAIWGVRVFSIPLEDFFYNIAYLGLSLLVYLLIGRGA